MDARNVTAARFHIITSSLLLSFNRTWENWANFLSYYVHLNLFYCTGLVLADNRLGTVESDIDGLPRNDGSEVVFEMLSEKERVVLDCAVKEYLMAAGYKIAAMTFQEEVL